MTAVDKGTMSEAAQSLLIVQSSLTSAIKELETELDITIFHRTDKGIIVTNEGSYNSSYFSWEIMSRVNRSMTINVSDRATPCDLAPGLHVGFNGVGHCKTKQGLPFHGAAAMIDDTYLTGKVSVGHHPFVDHFKFVKQFKDENHIAKQTIPAPALTTA